MKLWSVLDEYPIEKRVSVFMRNDRESPKGQRPLPSNQTSYIVRDVYPFTDGTTGYFITIVIGVFKALAEKKNNIIEIRAMNYSLNWYDWPEYLWNKLMIALKLKKLILYSRYCYSKGAIKGIKKHHLEKEVHYCVKHMELGEEDKQAHIMWPYAKSVFVLQEGGEYFYPELARRYLFEREKDEEKFNPFTLWVMHREPEVDPRGPGMRIYPHYAQFDHLQGEELVKAYLDSEPMIELILARCEQEIEIRINESLISVEEVVEKIRKALEPMQWRLEVEL